MSRSATPASFTVTNSTVAAVDVVHLSQASGTNPYGAMVTAVAAGSFTVTFWALSGTATSEADVNQQVAIFENSPEVSSVTVSNVTGPSLLGGGWTFSVTLIMNPSVFGASSQSQ